MAYARMPSLGWSTGQCRLILPSVTYPSKLSEAWIPQFCTPRLIRGICTGQQPKELTHGRLHTFCDGCCDPFRSHRIGNVVRRALAKQYDHYVAFHSAGSRPRNKHSLPPFHPDAFQRQSCASLTGYVIAHFRITFGTQTGQSKASEQRMLFQGTQTAGRPGRGQTAVDP
ncbi:hypothetical protein BJY00DRAFT_186030 [Aspergillus carlsbadensis]|nr:hypothetical protein BJY00DRAFT_186030 [Aspergillus carlsbadensis]